MADHILLILVLLAIILPVPLDGDARQELDGLQLEKLD